MPLVTRQANTGNLLVQDTEPADPKDGDVWTDLGLNPPIVKVNDAGTFRPMMQSGVFVQGDTVFANANNTLDRLAKGTNGQFLKIGASIPEWDNLTTLWEVLGDYEATSAEASHSFDFTAVDFDDDSMIVIVFDLACTLTLDLLCLVNSDTGDNYRSDGRSIEGGAETLIDINASSVGFLMANTAIFSTAADTCGGKTEITGNKANAGTRDNIAANTWTYGAVTQVSQMIGGTLNTDTVSVSNLTVQTSTSTWKTGSRITVYKVARA